MTVTPQDLLAGERIGRLDFAFAEFIERHSAPKAEDDSGRTARRAATDRALVALAAAAVSSHTSAGHVCLSVR